MYAIFKSLPSFKLRHSRIKTTPYYDLMFSDWLVIVLNIMFNNYVVNMPNVCFVDEYV